MDNKKDARGTGIFALKKNCTIPNCNVYITLASNTKDFILFNN